METDKTIEILQKMYELHLSLLNLSEEELLIFCNNNQRLIQNLKDSLSY